MNKIIIISLVIFFTICSKSWADVEVWECDTFERGDFDYIYKIDKNIPMVYVRVDGMWKQYYESTSNIKFLEDHDSIVNFAEDGERTSVWDLILKKKILVPDTKYSLVIPCRIKSND
jgi:hypothetical protein